jgi:hypothetical protein
MALSGVSRIASRRKDEGRFSLMRFKKTTDGKAVIKTNSGY